jgi:two-component system OmpR family sensor kinase
MFHTLRNRLFISYVAILMITLIIIGLALLVVIRTRPVPTDDIVNDLTVTLLEVHVVEVLQVTVDDRPSAANLNARIIAYLDEEAEARDVRALIITQENLVHYDSDDAFTPGEPFVEVERRPLLANEHRTITPNVYTGRFLNPDGSEWVYVGQPLRPGLMAMQTSRAFVVVAAPVPQISGREVLQTFGQEFSSPLARAGFIGLTIALLLSLLISRSVARPLQHMSLAAHRLAHGDFSQRVPERGPHEVRALARSFNNMASRVSFVQQAQRDFLANVSHDLRTPLTSIQGFSQAITDGVASDPESAQRAAAIIHDEAARLNRMVESLLDLARIEAGKLDMLRHAVQLGDLLRAVGDSLSVKAQENQLNMELRIPPDLPRIAGDGDRLAQVFTNLLDNAIKHTPPGGRVLLQAQTNHEGIDVTVADTGEGIPSEDLSRVFERFYQVDKSRDRSQRHGTGLGLAITRQIVEAHGGTIRVDSEVGQGTVFTIWLPLPTPQMTTLTLRRR